MKSVCVLVGILILTLPSSFAVQISTIEILQLKSSGDTHTLNKIIDNITTQAASGHEDHLVELLIQQTQLLNLLPC
jgi:hypothetical protein